MTTSSLKTLVLAAGFGTRLKEYGELLPKGLIPFQDKTIVGYLISELRRCGLTDISLITNAKYIAQYEAFATTQLTAMSIISDGSTSPENRKGALGDLLLAVQQLGWEKDNLLVVPSDTYFEFSLSAFIEKILKHPDQFHTIVREMEKDLIANRLGCAVINEHGQLTSFIEKPANPPSPYAAIPFYYYPQEILNEVHRYQSEGNSMDAPGSIIPWLIHENIPVYAHIVTQPTLDVGTVNEVKLLQSKTISSGI